MSFDKKFAGFTEEVSKTYRFFREDLLEIFSKEEVDEIEDGLFDFFARINLTYYNNFYLDLEKKIKNGFMHNVINP